MDSRNKYIGIESRVHFDVLEAAIVEYLLNDIFDKESCLKHIKQFTEGENRSGKILKHISVIITKNNYLLGQLKKQLKDSDYYHFSTDERKARILLVKKTYKK